MVLTLTMYGDACIIKLCNNMSIFYVGVIPNDPQGNCGNMCREGQCCGNSTCFCPVIKERILNECEGQFELKKHIQMQRHNMLQYMY